MLVRKLCQVLCGGLCWLLRTCPFYCSVLNLCQLCCSIYFGSMMMCWTYVSSIALCAMVSVFLWWKMRKQWRFLWTYCDENCHVLWRKLIYRMGCHMAQNCADTWRESVMTRGMTTMIHEVGTMNMWRHRGSWHGTGHVDPATSPASVSPKARSAVGVVHATWHSL